MSVDKDLVSVQQARDLIEAAYRAHAQVAEFDQAKIDRICEAMARAALTEAARLDGSRRNRIWRSRRQTGEEPLCRGRRLELLSRTAHEGHCFRVERRRRD